MYKTETCKDTITYTFSYKIHTFGLTPLQTPAPTKAIWKISEAAPICIMTAALSHTTISP